MTEYLIGKREKLSHVQETSFGDGGDMSTNGDRFGYNQTFEPGDWSRGWSEILNSGDGKLTVSDYAVGMKNYPYSLSFDVANFKFMKYVMDVSTTGSGPYTHTFTVPYSVVSYQLEREFPHSNSDRDIIIKLLGNFVKSITMSFEAQTGEEGGYIRVSMECNAQDHEYITSSSDVAALTRELFKFFHARVTIGSEEFKEVNSGEITIEKGINEENFRYANATLNRKIGEPIPGVFRISGRYNINLKDDELDKYWESDEPVTGTNKIEFIKNSSDDYALFEFNNFYLRRVNKPTNFEGPVAADVIWFADEFNTVEVVDDIEQY